MALYALTLPGAAAPAQSMSQLENALCGHAAAADRARLCALPMALSGGGPAIPWFGACCSYCSTAALCCCYRGSAAPLGRAASRLTWRCLLAPNRRYLRMHHMEGAICAGPPAGRAP